MQRRRWTGLAGAREASGGLMSPGRKSLLVLKLKEEFSASPRHHH